MKFDNAIQTIKESVLRVDEHGKNIVYENGDVIIAVNSVDEPTYFSLWIEGKREGGLYLSNYHKKRGDKYYAKLESVGVEPNSRGNRYGLLLYKVALQNLKRGVSGIYSYLPNTANKKQVPRIHKRLGGRVVDGDHMFIDK